MKSSTVWALLMTAAVIGWMASGELIIGGQGPTETRVNEAGETVPLGTTAGRATNDLKPFRVRVTRFEAEDRIAKLNVRGRTEAADRVMSMAQADGLVVELGVEKGDSVAVGDLVCRIETGARQAKVLGAEAAVAQAELEYTAASTLSERGFSTETKVRAAKAMLDAAVATLDLAKLDIKRTEIRSPVDGLVEHLPVETGSHLPIGGHCATIVALDPMRVIAQVSERDVMSLREGMVGTVKPINGEPLQGTIRYIAPTAEAATRTFRVELEIDNSDGAVRDGITTEVSIDLASTRAHRLPSSVLTLNDAGEIGVRMVDETNTVVFAPIRLLSDGQDGAWVSGLPDMAPVITVGQDYVTAGQVVEPVIETAGVAPDETPDEAPVEATQ